MLPEFAKGSPGWEAVFGLAIFGGSLIIAALVYILFNRCLRLLVGRTKTTLDDYIVKAMGWPIFLFVLVFGPYAALTATTYLDRWQDTLHRALLAAEIVIVGYAVKRLVDALTKWYAEEMAARTSATWDERVLPMVRRVANVMIFAVVLMLVLQSQGLNISPLIAGLGIGGLAVALALQPTLSNVIAGTYVVAESGIGQGHYIELDGGPSGWVEHVGWRTTKIKTFYNNLVIIPNSKLADSIVTDYDRPDPGVFASVDCGVSYESDLERVSNVTLEVVNGVLKESPGADLSSLPVVMFRGFGDSNIDFSVWFKAKTRGDQYVIKDQIIRSLHKRFKEEGIEINYPVRRLVFPMGDGVNPSSVEKVPSTERRAGS